MSDLQHPIMRISLLKAFNSKVSNHQTISFADSPTSSTCITPLSRDLRVAASYVSHPRRSLRISYKRRDSQAPRQGSYITHLSAHWWQAIIKPNSFYMMCILLFFPSFNDTLQSLQAGYLLLK